jgi:hypothetical protein
MKSPNKWKIDIMFIDWKTNNFKLAILYNALYTHPLPMGRIGRLIWIFMWNFTVSSWDNSNKNKVNIYISQFQITTSQVAVPHACNPSHWGAWEKANLAKLFVRPHHQDNQGKVDWSCALSKLKALSSNYSSSKKIMPPNNCNPESKTSGIST